MNTRSSDQQKKQRQKEFKERKEHQKQLKIAAKKGKGDTTGNDDEIDNRPKTES